MSDEQRVERVHCYSPLTTRDPPLYPCECIATLFPSVSEKKAM